MHIIIFDNNDINYNTGKNNGDKMNYNEVIILLVVALVAVAFVGLAIISQPEDNTTDNLNTTENISNTTENVEEITNDDSEDIATEDVNTGGEISSKRTYADMAHDLDAHTNPEKANELNNNIVRDEDGVTYFSDGSYIDTNAM